MDLSINKQTCTACEPLSFDPKSTYFNFVEVEHRNLQWSQTRVGTIRSAADTIHIRYGPCRYNTYSIRTLPIRYVFDTDLADMIRIRYDTHVHDLRFQN